MTALPFPVPQRVGKGTYTLADLIARQLCRKAPPPPALTVYDMNQCNAPFASRRRRAFARGFVLAGLGR